MRGARQRPVTAVRRRGRAGIQIARCPYLLDASLVKRRRIQALMQHGVTDSNPRAKADVDKRGQLGRELNTWRAAAPASTIVLRCSAPAGPWTLTPGPGHRRRLDAYTGAGRRQRGQDR